MSLNRNQEDEIALKVVHAWEAVRGKTVTAQDRARLREFEGAGKGIVDKDGCGERRLEARRKRGEGLEFRLALSPEAAKNGCRDEAKRWLDLSEAELRKLAARWERHSLPVDLTIVTVGADGNAVSQEGKASLDRGG